MKKFFFIVFAVASLAAVSCAKEKNCRCSVKNSERVHLIELGGDCAGVRTMEYYDASQTWRLDSVYCVEY